MYQEKNNINDEHKEKSNQQQCQENISARKGYNFQHCHKINATIDSVHWRTQLNATSRAHIRGKKNQELLLTLRIRCSFVVLRSPREKSSCTW